MNIAIIGAGNVGSALASALSKKGQKVCLVVNSPEKYHDLALDLGVDLTTIESAIATSDVVILAVPYLAALEIASKYPDWGNKILIDATNPLAAGLAGLLVGTTSSGAEEISKLAHHARVVKAFNTTGAENMRESTYQQAKIFMPVAGDDAQARSQVCQLAQLIGFDAVDMGDLYAARYIEPFAMTWIHLAFKQKIGRNFAFAKIDR